MTTLPQDKLMIEVKCNSPAKKKRKPHASDSAASEMYVPTTRIYKDSLVTLTELAEDIGVSKVEALQKILDDYYWHYKAMKKAS